MCVLPGVLVFVSTHWVDGFAGISEIWLVWFLVLLCAVTLGFGDGLVLPQFATGFLYLSFRKLGYRFDG